MQQQQEVELLVTLAVNEDLCSGKLSVQVVLAAIASGLQQWNLGQVTVTVGLGDKIKKFSVLECRLRELRQTS